MTSTIIPSINCLDWKCIEEKLAIAKDLSPWVHLDIADGEFTFHKTWSNAREWKEHQVPLGFEVHLMVEEPEKQAERWLQSGARRLIVHVETLTPESIESMHDLGRRYGAEIMLASNPETLFTHVEPYLHLFKSFQALAVHPGLAGQSSEKFLPLVLLKVKLLREYLPDATIEVDGGITPETAKRAKDAGADLFVSASYIFSSQDPKGAYKELVKAVS